MPRPICFMVMPYGTKETGLPPGKQPQKVNFDRLWTLALKPVLEELGYTAVRADQDLGASIIREMIERLALSDLVLADLSISNANVFYEVGIRHAAKQTGCVLVAADWARLPFDAAQMRRVSYPLPDGTVPSEAVPALQKALRSAIPRLRDSATPCFELEGFPELRREKATSFKKFLRELAAFEAKVNAIRLISNTQKRANKTVQFARKYSGQPLATSVAMELLLLLRDCSDQNWEQMLSFIQQMPDSEFQQLPLVQEQRNLAISKLGKHEEAIAALEQLIQLHGETPERRGLLGGRWKRLYLAARERAKKGTAADKAEARRNLNRAIEQYERGMQLDLNEYYCASNLPRLLRQRNQPGDPEHATRIAHVVTLSCERKRQSRVPDKWLKPTLLGAAFDAGDVQKARSLAEELHQEGPAAWELETTLADLEESVARQPDGPAKAELSSLLEELRALLPAPARGSGRKSARKAPPGVTPGSRPRTPRGTARARAG